ncbi:methionyl-tRNA formyltransferase [Pseudonocardia sp. HH130630-07]|uniref:methionyl-tRNA formyltransferase n=1 Tax=Pseudonocardia sp. HH130630-07 TaxID=1690815 RepID=UPI000814DC14|nr:methionyl-tRNA formyltransferase [Pseudonocardia sp. HH130630-07]ANY09639.1 methionyl-tRNA formyltransferase [Pseudonocardia sp. HH130630-07]
MRVVLFGYQKWGTRLLADLLDSRHEVVLVVSHPDNGEWSPHIFDEPLDALAAEHGIPVVYREKAVDDELVETITRSGAEIGVACNWRTWISPAVFSAPPRGTVNTHDSLLPRYAGFSPLNWALINGESQVGITAHWMDADLDRGPIICQRTVPVTPTDTTEDLFHRTVRLFGPLALEAFDRAEHGPHEWLTQDPAHASFFHKRADEDNRIPWDRPAADLVNLVRAQTGPYPNAWCEHEGRRLRVLEASVSRERCGGTTGRVFAREGTGVIVVAGPEAWRGGQHGLVLQRVRDADGTEHVAGDYFRRMGGYLT